jgi:hypothetical protein
VQDLAGVASVSARLEAVLTRLAGHYRSMPESKLLGRMPDGRTRAAAGHTLAELIAFAAQGVEERGLRGEGPRWRRLPFEGPFVVGDQIGVTGHDLLVACRRAGMGDGAGDGAVDVWAPPGVGDGRMGIASVVEGVLRRAEGLGRDL